MRALHSAAFTTRKQFQNLCSLYLVKPLTGEALLLDGGHLQFGGFVEDGGFVLAGAAAMVWCPGAVVAGEGQPEVVAGGLLLGPVVELECGESCGAAVVDGVDDGCCCLGGETFALICGQTGDRQGGAVEIDGSSGAGLGGGGDVGCVVFLGLGEFFFP